MQRHQPTQTNAPAGNVANKCQGKMPGETKSEAYTPPGGNPMKAGELKKLLEAVPDFYEILIDADPDEGELAPTAVLGLRVEAKAAEAFVETAFP